MVAWRVVKTRYARSAFTGDGASRYGGRWNSRGVAVIYASGSKALAALEILVHLNPPVHFEYVAFRIEMEDAHVERLSENRLPPKWQTEPPPPATKRIGDLWIRGNTSVALEVPSVIVPGELNYLLNPFHRDFAQLRIAPAEPFALDPRLLQ